MRANRVVLPAPLGPISAVMRPGSAASETLSTARKPPKRLLTPSTRTSSSAMGGLRRYAVDEAPARRAEKTHHAIGGERHHQDQDTAVDDEVEAGRVAGDELGDLAQRLDHEGAEQRAE